MARISSADVGFLLISGMNVLSDATMIEDEQEGLIEDTTVLGDSYEQQGYVGVKRFGISQEGFFNDAANAINAALVTPGASKVLSYAPATNTLGARFVSSPMIIAKYVRQIARGALTKAKATYQSEGNHDEGKIVATLAARGAASNTQATSLDNAAASSNGCAATLQMTSLSLGGYTNIIVKLQDSADNASFADIITFTAVTAAPAAERKTLTGSIRRYLAAAWAYTGSGSDPTATWTLGVARG
ncbi:MAG: hypothetical protein AB7P33_09860 [Dehalococcoidia bacterium]